jgi:hypothetical protein
LKATTPNAFADIPAVMPSTARPPAFSVMFLPCAATGKSVIGVMAGL